jgi:hypothetical protein
MFQEVLLNLSYLNANLVDVGLYEFETESLWLLFNFNVLFFHQDSSQVMILY